MKKCTKNESVTKRKEILDKNGRFMVIFSGTDKNCSKTRKESKIHALGLPVLLPRMAA
jgi:hypothetical protein